MRSRTSESDALSLVGLARRAGDALVGTDATRRGLRGGGVRLVLTAEDASRTQLKKVLGLARRKGVPHRVVADRSELGRALGAGPVTAVAVTNPSLAQQILEELPGPTGGGTTVRDTGGK